jgi:hypothetical protein
LVPLWDRATIKSTFSQALQHIHHPASRGGDVRKRHVLRLGGVFGGVLAHQAEEAGAQAVAFQDHVVLDGVILEGLGESAASIVARIDLVVGGHERGQALTRGLRRLQHASGVVSVEVEVVVAECRHIVPDAAHGAQHWRVHWGEDVEQRAHCNVPGVHEQPALAVERALFLCEAGDPGIAAALDDVSAFIEAADRSEVGVEVVREADDEAQIPHTRGLKAHNHLHRRLQIVPF